MIIPDTKVAETRANVIMVHFSNSCDVPDLFVQ